MKAATIVPGPQGGRIEIREIARPEPGKIVLAVDFSVAAGGAR